MHSERCTSGSARGCAKPLVARPEWRACPTQRAPCKRGWRNPSRAGWLPTGSWNAAPLGKEIERKGAAKLCQVLMAGCHKQSSLNSTGRGPLSTSRATTVSMVRQRSVRRKPLYLERSTLDNGMAWRDMWSDSVGLYVADWRMREAHSTMGFPLSHRPEPSGVEHVT
jgi:hypothetical protein